MFFARKSKRVWMWDEIQQGENRVKADVLILMKHPSLCTLPPHTQLRHGKSTGFFPHILDTWGWPCFKREVGLDLPTSLIILILIPLAMNFKMAGNCRIRKDSYDQSTLPTVRSLFASWLYNFISFVHTQILLQKWGESRSHTYSLWHSNYSGQPARTLLQGVIIK